MNGGWRWLSGEQQQLLFQGTLILNTFKMARHCQFSSLSRHQAHTQKKKKKNDTRGPLMLSSAWPCSVLQGGILGSL